LRAGFESGNERARAHLTDDAYGLVHSLLRQFGQYPHRPDAPFPNRALDNGLVDFGGNRGEPIAMTVTARHFIEDLEETFEVRLTARRVGRTNYVGHAG
jgi:hypothetical protein